MSTFKFDNHGELPTGLTEVTNDTGRPERVYTREEIQQTWDNLKMAMVPVMKDLVKVWDNLKMAMVPVMKDLVKVWDELHHNRKLMDTIAQLQAIDQGNRYWHDHQGQPHRNPTMRPLLHNGRKPQK